MSAALRAKRILNNMTASLFNFTPTENIQRVKWEIKQLHPALKWNENKFEKKPTVSVFVFTERRSAYYSFYSAEASQRTEEETSGSHRVFNSLQSDH